MNIRSFIRSVLKEEMNDDHVDRLRHVKVTFEDGNFIETPINGTKKEILNHYIGQYFDMGSGETEKMVKAVNVDFLG